jgi:hypothetical protein
VCIYIDREGGESIELLLLYFKDNGDCWGKAPFISLSVTILPDPETCHYDPLRQV